MSRIALVKPDKARGVENMILAAAQRGALQEKVRGVKGGGKGGAVRGLRREPHRAVAGGSAVGQVLWGLPKGACFVHAAPATLRL